MHLNNLTPHQWTKVSPLFFFFLAKWLPKKCHIGNKKPPGQNMPREVQDATSQNVSQKIHHLINLNLKMIIIFIFNQLIFVLLESNLTNFHQKYIAFIL